MATTRTDLAKTAPARTPAKRPSRAKAPAGAKQPADHRPAKDDVTGPKDTTIEWQGHEYLVKGENMDDVELVEHFTDDNFIGALRIMLGPQGWRDYKENSRNENGRVTATGANEFLEFMLDELKRKNS